MRKKVLIVAILLAVTAGLVIRCAKQNHNPVISLLNAPTSVNVNGSASLSCSASDPDGDPLTYDWTCTEGSLSSSSGSSVTWTAPGTSGSATVTVSVHDDRGGADSRSKTITVNAVTTTLIDWSGQVARNSWTYWNLDLESGYIISGNFSVDNYDISFLILDESNYENWRNSKSYTYVVKVVQSAGTSFSATIYTTGTYYAVLDNTYSWFTDKFAHLFMQQTSP
jgi:hypothetical protein